MMHDMEISNSTEEDLNEIFRLYDVAAGFQKVRFPQNQWPRFEKSLIEREIAEHRQFKLLIDDKIACIWAVTYSDPQIWPEDDGRSAIYIHRIAANPEFRGNNFVRIIVDWAKGFAAEKKYIRMDTCGNNTRLIRHYESCGFHFLGIRKLKDATGLPSHYHDADVCYFEIALDR